MTSIKQYSHRHMLTHESSPAPRCHECGERVLGAFHSYPKNGRIVHVHKICLHPPKTISPALFDCPEFKLYRDNSRGRICDACLREIKGLAYQSCCGVYDLHPFCSTLADTLQEIENNDGKGKGKVVVLKLTNRSLPSKCLECEKTKKNSPVKKAKGWSYVSGCGKHCLHVQCLLKMVEHALDIELSGDPFNIIGLSSQPMVKFENSNNNTVSPMSIVVKVLKVGVSIVLGNDLITPVITEIIPLVQSICSTN